MASPDNATQHYLYRARLDGVRHARARHAERQPGRHTYVLAPGAKLAFHTWSRFERRQ